MLHLTPAGIDSILYLIPAVFAVRRGGSNNSVNSLTILDIVVDQFRSYPQNYPPKTLIRPCLWKMPSYESRVAGQCGGKLPESALLFFALFPEGFSASDFGFIKVMMF